ncbi:oxytetracycline resistance phosphoribosyltransferase domain-containing protein Tet(34) [Vibrio sp. AND4]|uniref:oxytetracycline resistance phosphoribosyltransferase domain-containing protein Tet(34) n=1 Tax=Vibrio sp. AND4 TaxID=314289 RepID=UPI00015F274B|nr:oxytetracycline resistance phosphoribosyltransferase domain-containing protein Tet(34) [Vibrio sp. AND4]EDP57581.1 xanthine-guanine phosphoribosyltransferase [Vibrio sp. AND4]
MSKKFIITWDAMQSYCRELAEKQMPAEQWKGIWAVSRGGLVPGAILARELGIRYVDTICISSYDHDHQRDMTVLKAPEGDGEGYLIIEDLVDSGDTARQLREMYPKAKLIAVCAKPSGKELLDDYVVDIAQDTWIEQPWDMSIQYAEPVNRKQK